VVSGTYVPLISLITNCEPDAIARARAEGIRVQQCQRLPELALRVPLELFATHGERAK
jgi:hypothetical protein